MTTSLPRVGLVGVGAVGSHAALLLRGAALLRLVDFDRIESKNTLGQFHSVKDVGKNKAVSLAANLAFIFKVGSTNNPVQVNDLNVEQVLEKEDLILDCTDNIKARLVLAMFSIQSGKPLLHAAMSADGSFARVVWRELFKPDQEEPGAATCEDGENLPFHGLVGAYTALVAQQFLKTGKKISLHITPTGVMRIA